MVHVYKELIAPLIAIKTPKIRATCLIWYMFLSLAAVSAPEHSTKNRITLRQIWIHVYKELIAR